MRVLNSFGIPVPEHTQRVVGVEAAWQAIVAFKQTRGTLDYGTDGMVVKVDSREQREQLGVTSKAPRWVIAFKYPAEQVQTTLEGVTWQVGKNGTLTPVAQLTAVFVAGTTVRRSTLHNIEQIERLDLHVGDTIVLEKAGEVIPQVVQAVIGEAACGGEARAGAEALSRVQRAGREGEGHAVHPLPQPRLPAQLKHGSNGSRPQADGHRGAG
jgi:DNA ligase (NAD+)